MKIKVIVVLISCLFLQGCALVGLAQMSNTPLLWTPKWKTSTGHVCPYCRSGRFEEYEEYDNEHYHYGCLNCGKGYY